MESILDKIDDHPQHAGEEEIAEQTTTEQPTQIETPIQTEVPHQEIDDGSIASTEGLAEKMQQLSMPEEQQPSSKDTSPSLPKEPEEQKAPTQKAAAHHQKKEFYQVIEDDKYLKQFEHDINARQQKLRNWKAQFESEAGTFLEFTRSYKKFGLNINSDGDLVYREWAPGAKELSLFGDFNDWNRDSHKCKRDQFGHFSLVLPKYRIILANFHLN